MEGVALRPVLAAGIKRMWHHIDGFGEKEGVGGETPGFIRMKILTMANEKSFFLRMLRMICSQ